MIAIRWIRERSRLVDDAHAGFLRFDGYAIEFGRVLALICGCRGIAAPPPSVHGIRRETNLEQHVLQT